MVAAALTRFARAHALLGPNHLALLAQAGIASLPLGLYRLLVALSVRLALLAGAVHAERRGRAGEAFRVKRIIYRALEAYLVVDPARPEDRQVRAKEFNLRISRHWRRDFWLLIGIGQLAMFAQSWKMWLFVMLALPALMVWAAIKTGMALAVVVR